MELSMWILQDWLKKYHPLSDIKEGTRCIKNVRLLSEDRNYSGLTVYLNPQGDDRVICSCGQDYMILNSDNPDEIFNEILDAFEYYNDWDSRMTDMIYQGCTLKELLVEGHRVIQNYLVVADSTFLIREGYGNEDDMQKNQSYYEAFQRKLLPVEVLSKFDSDPNLRSLTAPPYLLEIPSMQKVDIVSNIVVRNVHMGWVICMRSDNQYEQITLDLMHAFTRHINQWYLVHSQEERFMNRTAIFLEILEQTYSDDQHILHRLEAVNWYPADQKLIYVIRAGKQPISNNTVVLKHSEKIFSGSFAVEYQGDVLLFVNLSLCAPNSEELLPALLTTSGYQAGKSAIFQNILDLPQHYEAARIAAEHAGPDYLIRSFQRTALPYFRKLIQQHTPIPLEHPALQILKDYDANHNIDLYDTLRAFLENKCSHTATADALYIHRSTLLYRIDKIVTLTGIDLDQYQTRLHLEVSYLLQEE